MVKRKVELTLEQCEMLEYVLWEIGEYIVFDSEEFVYLQELKEMFNNKAYLEFQKICKSFNK